MRVFVTGASGFVGSAVIPELLAAGHQVLGLARSDASAKSLSAMGALVHRGELTDLESLRRGADETDGVIHLAFVHDFSKYAESGAIDRQAIETMGEVLAGSNRPLIVTSGTALLAQGGIATEETPPRSGDFIPRVSETAAETFTARSVRTSAVRLAPSVHGDGDKGFVPMLIALAREKGVSAYIGDGRNRWTGVHRLDAGRLYRLVLEKGIAGARYHGVAEESITFRDIAEAIGQKLNIPVVSKTQEEAAEHFGWFMMFASMDAPASNTLTRERLGWAPKEVGLIADLERGTYFTA